MDCRRKREKSGRTSLLCLSSVSAATRVYAHAVWIPMCFTDTMPTAPIQVQYPLYIRFLVLLSPHFNILFQQPPSYSKTWLHHWRHGSSFKPPHPFFILKTPFPPTIMSCYMNRALCQFTVICLNLLTGLPGTCPGFTRNLLPKLKPKHYRKCDSPPTDIGEPIVTKRTLVMLLLRLRTEREFSAEDL